MSELLLKMPVPYEVKLTNRWLIRFKGDYKDIPSWVLSKTSRPKWEATESTKEINNANSWGIKGGWSNIEIYLRDPILANSTAKVLMTAARIAGLTSAKNKIKYDLELLDPCGVVIETWKIKGLVELFDFGPLDYAKDDLVEIKLVIKPTKVKLCF